MADNAISELQQLQKVTAEKQLSAPELHFQVVDGGNRDVSSSETVMDQPAMAGKGFTEKFECKVLSGPGSNIARYKSMSPASLPIVRSPCLTIPPGLSPTALLDSPVLLSNMQQAEPSPTTGTFSLPPIKHDGVGSDNFSSPRDTSSNSAYEDGSSDSFAFKPDAGSYSSSGLPSFRALAPRSSNYQQCPQPVQVQGQHQTQPLASLSAVKTEQLSVSAHELSLSVPAPDPPVYTVTSRAIITAEVASDEPWQRHGSESQTQALQFDQKGPSPLTVVERPSEDGYNWRKYGQKQVKGSEFPRSYYKCTHPNCQMKKHLERSHDGQITEIIYKGSHDHPKPQPSRRLAVGAVLASQDEERSEGLCTSTNAEDKSSNAHAHPSYHIESNGTPELPSVSASDDDVEGAAARSKMGNEVQEDDPESKRRKLEVGVNDATPMSRATREQRVVVQTLSEVDILDDGYRWRKYGQKVVKGNPNPRSYYKCTNAGCPVRKHVERASHDPKAVITTYEGKHNHDVPTTRTSSLEMAGPSIAQNVNTLNDTRTISYYYERSEEKDAISLDLGVGIGQSPENGPNEKQQTTDSEQVPSQVLEIAPISAFCGGLYGDENHFGSREDQGESFSFKNPALNHSSSQYNQNMGRLLMGP